ncbi:helix-turn-helix transcriptional regulator [Paenibacillus hamazuiensis]|uniref:helix-turn-helix transcriptional regulator n=1 Tax=Paenibacillus hamazuiensis TaxID=2936508 RepID=UPI00200D4D37|nr:helix-turn-helix transcriptional regulator [Paenibacillus hamazuiensis]
MNEDQRRKELAEFLKSRRLRVSPEEAGLKYAGGSGRRLSGLRREEVAVLSGISLPWYTALEQGRDIRVSEQVLESLVRTFKLGRDERLYLYALANQQTPLLEVTGTDSAELPSLQYIADRFADCPAFFSDQRWNVRIWNRMAALVFGDLGSGGEYAGNMVWRMFAEKNYRRLFVDWEHVAKTLLAQLRSYYARNLDDSWYERFAAALSERSSLFRQWWEGHEVRCASLKTVRIEHPLAGLLQLEVHEFYRCEDEGTALSVFIPKAGTDCRERLEELMRTGEHSKV